MNVPPNIIAVLPNRMLTVTLQYPGQQLQVNAIACRYIATDVPGIPHPVIAVEVIRDPMNQVPLQQYQCYANVLEVIVLPANALLHVRPYLFATTEPHVGGT